MIRNKRHHQDGLPYLHRSGWRTEAFKNKLAPNTSSLHYTSLELSFGGMFICIILIVSTVRSTLKYVHT